MALSAKRDDFKFVPWFSITEWYRVYKQVYSNDVLEQIKAYETLAAWKTRVPKLPVGIECTLIIMGVCLRDREWTAKINSQELPITYENDLSNLYSITIMKFLNHISFIGNTKQTSLFQIAKQLKIPEWIVNLRHDAAHGHELASIGVLRTACNLLLIWLHEEYWVTEVKNFEENYQKRIEYSKTEYLDEEESFEDLVELWTAVNLYMIADYIYVTDISDSKLRETLYDLHAYVLNGTSSSDNVLNSSENSFTTDDLDNKKKFKLSTAKSILFNEISRNFNKAKGNVILNVLMNSEAFFPNSELLSIFNRQSKNEGESMKNNLPNSMLKFWQDIISLLQEKRLLEKLIFKLLSMVKNKQENSNKRQIAALWLSSIFQSFIKLNLSQNIIHPLGHEKNDKNKKVSLKLINSEAKKEVNRTHPHLKDTLWLNVMSTIPNSLTNINVLFDNITNINKFSALYIKYLFMLAVPNLNNKQKEMSLNIIKIYTSGGNSKNNINTDKSFTINDSHIFAQKENVKNNVEGSSCNIQLPNNLFMNTRISECKLASDNLWNKCPIGTLPWKIGSLQVVEPFEFPPNQFHISTPDFQIVPGIINLTNLKMRSQIKWNDILITKKKQKRKWDNGDVEIINKAIETVQKTKRKKIQ